MFTVHIYYIGSSNVLYIIYIYILVRLIVLEEETGVDYSTIMCVYVYLYIIMCGSKIKFRRVHEILFCHFQFGKKINDIKKKKSRILHLDRIHLYTRAHGSFRTIRKNYNNNKIKTYSRWSRWDTNTSVQRTAVRTRIIYKRKKKRRRRIIKYSGASERASCIVRRRYEI